MKVLLVVAILVAISSAKIYSKCELARRMYNAGFSRKTLPDWMCLVDAESSFNTKAINRVNVDGSSDYGIFQINDRYWCYPGTGCSVDCPSLMNDDIEASMRCAKIIYNDRYSNGFNAWTGWKNKCRGRSLEKYSVDECFNNDSYYFFFKIITKN
ncbi:lysozyme c-1-like [Chironomus tepperi]|uniref:lysozyme c-1-like n=1 Tax=Chironomus tepperi TaxID=113505 RepID=UPI00391EEF79